LPSNYVLALGNLTFTSPNAILNHGGGTLSVAATNLSRGTYYQSTGVTDFNSTVTAGRIYNGIRLDAGTINFHAQSTLSSCSWGGGTINLADAGMLTLASGGEIQVTGGPTAQHVLSTQNFGNVI